MPSVSRLDKACRALGLTVCLGKNLNIARENQENTHAVSTLAAPFDPEIRKPRGGREKRGISTQGPGHGIEAHTQGLVRAVHAAGGDPIPPDLRGALAGKETDEPPGARPVDVVELACAAGGGAEVLSEDAIGRVWFRRDWLDEHGLDATQCVVLGVHGDSMQPTLVEGAKILINRAARERRTNRIYVMRTDAGVIVKRLSKAGPKDWRLVSDNIDKTAWPNITMPLQAEIIGQVVWTARTL